MREETRVRSEAQEGHAGGDREERGRGTGGPGRRSWEESRGLQLLGRCLS